MLALLLFLTWAIAEILVAIKVAEAIGVVWMLLALIAGWPLGVWLTRTQGRSAWRRLSDAVAAGRAPGREVADGALILLGGLLLIVPGFISDVFGLLLLARPTRALARHGLERNVRSRFVVAATGFGSPARRDYDVDSTASDVNQPQLHG